MEKSMIPPYEAQDFKHENNGEATPPSLTSDRRFLTFFIIAMVICAFLAIGYLNQQKELYELQTHEAYLISSLIDSQENSLLLKYQLFPEQVGLGELRSAWKDNPCYETSHAYSDALSKVLEYLENGQTPFTPTDLGSGVQV